MHSLHFSMTFIHSSILATSWSQWMEQVKSNDGKITDDELPGIIFDTV